MKAYQDKTYLSAAISFIKGNQLENANIMIHSLFEQYGESGIRNGLFTGL